jgi:hypothetical protein
MGHPQGGMLQTKDKIMLALFFEFLFGFAMAAAKLYFSV